MSENSAQGPETIRVHASHLPLTASPASARLVASGQPKLGRSLPKKAKFPEGPGP